MKRGVFTPAEQVNKDYETRDVGQEQFVAGKAKLEQAVSDYSPTAHWFEMYDAENQKYQEELAAWKSTIRDAETIQAEIDALDDPQKGGGEGGFFHR